MQQSSSLRLLDSQQQPPQRKEQGVEQSTSHISTHTGRQSVGQQQTPKAERELGTGGHRDRGHTRQLPHVLSRESDHQPKTEPSYTLLPANSQRRGAQSPTPGPAPRLLVQLPPLQGKKRVEVELKAEGETETASFPSCTGRAC